jgi:Zn-dependent peptidase ImmA (M78 family)
MTARNFFIDERTKQEIDGIVDRVHRDLKSKDDKIQLPDVRELLKLDLRYYSSSDPSLLDDVVHKMRIGAHQMLKVPGKLIEIITKFDLSAMFLPERRRILLDTNLPDPKKRWAESHEITHSLLSWHQEYMLGDTLNTISPGCHEEIEAEANYGAGRLLYPTKSLVAVANSAAPSMKHIREIANHFGNTITSALWRYVELIDFPCVGIIGDHPQYSATTDDAILYFIRSPKFVARFGQVQEIAILHALKAVCSFRRGGGPLGTGQVVLNDVDGVPHTFLVELFSNTHQVLTLMSYVRQSATQIVVSV